MWHYVACWLPLLLLSPFCNVSMTVSHFIHNTDHIVAPCDLLTHHTINASFLQRVYDCSTLSLFSTEITSCHVVSFYLYTHFLRPVYDCSTLNFFTSLWRVVCRRATLLLLPFYNVSMTVLHLVCFQRYQVMAPDGLSTPYTIIAPFLQRVIDCFTISLFRHHVACLLLPLLLLPFINVSMTGKHLACSQQGSHYGSMFSADSPHYYGRLSATCPWHFHTKFVHNRTYIMAPYSRPTPYTIIAYFLQRVYDCSTLSLFRTEITSWHHVACRLATLLFPPFCNVSMTSLKF